MKGLKARVEMRKWVEVSAPATIGNLGPGFDVLGATFFGLSDIVRARPVAEKGVRIISLTGEKEGIPVDPEKNTASIAAKLVLDAANSDFGIELELEKGIPPRSGLGSSAASACAGAFAANLLLGELFTREGLIKFAVAAEEVVSGAAFADNAAPCMLGGMVLVRNVDPLEVVPLGSLDAIFVVALPDFGVATRESRRILPRQVPLDDVVRNLSACSALVAGVLMKDVALFGKGVDDRLIEPVRARLIPGFYHVKERAIGAGALGFSISGSGPAVFAVVQDDMVASKVAGAMKSAFEDKGHGSRIITGKIDTRGVRISSASAGGKVTIETAITD